MKKSILRSLLLIIILLSVCGIAYLLLRHFHLNNLPTLRVIVNKGMVGVIIYVALQALQVVFIPVSTTIFTIPAIVLFGATKAFFISWIGCTLGSILMFLITRKWGIKVLRWIVGEDKAVKYANFLGKGKYLLPLFLLVPIFPDDIMCASAGISNIHPLYFMVVITITRCIDTACTCFIGTALIQSVPGIIALCVFSLIMLIISIYMTKNQAKIENFINKLLKRED